MFIVLIFTGLIVLVLKKADLVPAIILCQVSAIAIICYRLGMEVPLVVLAFAVKAFIVPLLLYYIIRKTIVTDRDDSAIPLSVLIALTLALFVAAYLFDHQLHAGPFATAAVFTALIGILCMTSRKTIVGQLIGFIVLQNGIFAFTSSFCLKFSFAIELILAFDVLFSVLIMVYAIQTIYKNLGSIDIKTFNSLRG
jgi:Hydrogenase 4 membrane component (E)